MLASLRGHRGNLLRTSALAVAMTLVVSLVPASFSGTPASASIPFDNTGKFGAHVMRATYYDIEAGTASRQVALPDAYLKFRMRGWSIPAEWSCYNNQSYYVDLYNPATGIWALDVPVLEAGPWNEDDGVLMPQACGGANRRAAGDAGSLNNGSPSCWSTTTDYPWRNWRQLPAGITVAEAASRWGFNNSMDQFCRVSNGAGIDLSRAVSMELTGLSEAVDIEDLLVVYKWHKGLTTSECWNNMTFSGLPASQGTSHYISYNWGQGGPVGQNDDFSAKFTNRYRWGLASDDIYCLYLFSDDGSRIYIGGQDSNRPWEASTLRLDHWGDHGLSTRWGCVTLSSTATHPMKIEYYENTGDAAIWAAAQPWTIFGEKTYMASEFYPNLTLANHATCVNYVVSDWPTYEWGTGAPCGDGFPSDNWSSRHLGLGWAGVSGDYTFTVTTDDGVRVYVNDVLIIDKWFDQGATTYGTQIWLEGGRWHHIRIEHYEATGSATLAFSTTLQR